MNGSVAYRIALLNAVCNTTILVAFGNGSHQDGSERRIRFGSRDDHLSVHVEPQTWRHSCPHACDSGLAAHEHVGDLKARYPLHKEEPSLTFMRA